ncbi:MAG: hypothetical protein ISP82_03650 [Candidatus Poseidoniaceae archaeon]|nr:hypothetical protein [Candidatus Poseidoniaceae archaeon]MBL6896183.1 hypothetical protein [Candidatus Poseidoniaceae archaeon]
MNDILETNLFRDVKIRINSIVEKIQSANSVAIFATADLESILSMAYLESAMIDANVPYSRKILQSKTHLPKGEDYNYQSNADLVISIEHYEDTWQHQEIDESSRLRIVPIAISINHPNSDKNHQGALDVVIQCAAIASEVCPNGARVRRLRPLSGVGHWLRESLDNSYDPVYTKIRDILQDEGSIRLLSLPEITNPGLGMLPRMSVSMLKRLTKKWPKMAYEQRQQALSELALPCLSNDKLSTPRLEELIWYRVVVAEKQQDLHSQIYNTQEAWPQDIDASKSFAANLLKQLITEGQLI